MRTVRSGKPLQLLGLLISLLLVLARCGGNNGSGDQGDAAPRVGSVTLQLTRPTPATSTTRHEPVESGQVRQVQPGEPEFIERLAIRVQHLSGVDLLPPQVFPLDASEQETMTRDVALPTPTPAQFLVRISAFNNFNNEQTEIFLAETVLQLGEERAVLTLVRNPATPSNLPQPVFSSTDGVAFGLSEAPVALPISTPHSTPDTSQMTPNDPDASQTHTVNVTTPPTYGGETAVDVTVRNTFFFILDTTRLDASTQRLQ